MIKNIFHKLILFFIAGYYSYFAFAQDNLHLNILDSNSYFEERLLDVYSKIKYEESPVSLVNTYTSDCLNIYKLTRTFDENLVAKFPDMNASEYYILRIFKANNLDKDFLTILINNNPVYQTWFTTFYKTIIDSKLTNKILEGMLPFLNDKNLKILNASEDPNIAMNQLVEMAGAVARQVNMLNNQDSKNILSTIKIGDNAYSMLNIPESSLMHYIFTQTEFTIINLLEVMLEIVKGVEYLHNNQIAHGSLELKNIFIHNNNIVIAGLERYSILADSSGIKNFTFYNNCYSAPELRYPQGEEQKWAYTNATLEGDIYSLGIIFTAFLYIYFPDEITFSELFKKHKISEYTEHQASFNALFNNNPSLIKNYKLYLSYNLWLHTKYILDAFYAVIFLKNDSLKENEKTIGATLYDIKNSCINHDANKRLEITKIKLALSQLIAEYQ